MTSNITVFESLCTNLNRHEALHIPSPPYQKRRAAVAAILRWRRHRTDIEVGGNEVTNLKDFFEQDWVKQDPLGEAEILFMQRATRVGDRWSGHVSFVGGKNEPNETDEDTVKREVMEEIGIDLNTKDYIQVGKLDEREISSIKDNKLLMILIPFVYLQVVPESPTFKLQESEVAAVQWVPLSFFLSTHSYASYRPITEQLSLVRLNKNKWATPLIRFMMGSVTFAAIDLPTSTNFRLWGLTMGMTRDIVEFTGLDNLSFVKMVNDKPIYSRPDIGWLALLFTQFTVSYKKLTTNIDYGAKSEWDKVYFASIRRAVIFAVLLRLGFTGVIITWLIKRYI
ncbi:NUDIX hydrolase domain-like protein [Thamnidium elegans]|nr:NUDIX hydrolase domain-like protein [Thamnidium elegans]